MATNERNMNDFCRLCACETINGVVIYSSEGLHLCLEEKILQCLRIEISEDDMLPKKVCCPCQSRLEESHRFAVQANEVQHTLELLLQKSRMVEQNIDVKLEELDIKDRIKDLPLDVTIETDSERRNGSRIVTHCENYTITGVQSSYNVENQLKEENGRRDECSNIYKSKRKTQDPKTDCVQTSELETNQNDMCSFPSPSQCLVSDDAENVDANDQEKRESDGDIKDSWEDEDEGEEEEEEEEDEAHEYEIEEHVEEMNIVDESESHNELIKTYKLDSTTNENLIESGTKYSTAEEEDDDDDEVEEEDGKDVDENTKEEWKTHWGIKCNECDEVFPYRSQFDKHYRGSYDKIPIYTCSYCNKSMEKYSTFRSHCYRHVTEGRYRCEYCQKGFSLRSMLHVHILAKHTSVKPFICEECGKGFVTRPGLNIHLKKHKTDEKQEYPCSECGKILRTRGGLTAHENVHRLGRRFMCDVCGKTFTQKANLQQHHKAHTGERPFACHRCGKRFAEKSHLNRHNSFHSEKRPFQCSVCLKTYKTERCLKVHAMVHSEARPYVCTYCNKGFLSSTKLKQHYNIHTGERPYACKFCERTFTNYPNWLKHTRRRHKEFMNVGSSAVNTRSQASVVQSQDTLQQSEEQHEHHQQDQQHQHERLFQQQLSQHNPDRRNSLDNSCVVSLQTPLSDVSPQLSENCMESTSTSSLEMLQQYSSSGPTKLVQPLSPHDTQKCQVVSHQPAHHQQLEQTFSLPQVYPDHLMSIHPHNILPL